MSKAPVASCYPLDWMDDFRKHLERGKHVLLYGNVDDQFVVSRAGRERGPVFTPLVDFVTQHFLNDGFEIVVHYDIVDGRRFAAPAMEDLFRAAVIPPRRASSAGGGASASPSPKDRRPADRPAESHSPGTGQAGLSPSATGHAYDPRGGVPGVPQVEGSRAGASPAGITAELEGFRTVLRQDQVSAAVVIHFSDRLVCDPDRQQGDAELQRMVLLKKLLHGAVRIHEGHPLAGRMNSAVLIANQLGKFPPWLYHDDARLALVRVPKPGRDERGWFLEDTFDHFEKGADVPVGEARARIVRDYANLTDGLTTLDLEAIRRTSLFEKLEIARPKKLVDYYKYGRRDDPWERLHPSVLAEAREQLSRQVIGQETAVAELLDLLVDARGGIRLGGAQTARPKGAFFFVGPTGVGKTELAKALAKLVFSDESALCRFDMSEYQQEHTAERFTGSPPGYVAYEEGGQLTNRVMQRPFSILLFDEIEKAHPRVMDKFLSVLDDGRLTDGRGQTAYFSQCAIIFTSNIGSDGLRELSSGAPRHLTRRSASTIFPPCASTSRRGSGVPSCWGGWMTRSWSSTSCGRSASRSLRGNSATSSPTRPWKSTVCT